MPGALDGVRIVDLTAVLLGPYATQILADMGADVIKIEPPQGDLLRASGRGRSPGMGPIYIAANRNKRSIVLDLKKESAREVVLDMARTADVFVSNFRPQAMDRLGLGYERVRQINPGIVYACACGYGSKGPYGAKPAFDDLVQGASGIATLQSRIDGSAPGYMPTLIADKTTGLHLAIAILAALFHRQRTGQGQAVEVPMLETMASFVLAEHLFGHTFVPPAGTMGYDRILNPNRHPFPTADGYICALPYSDKHWDAFFEITGRPDLAQDPRFNSQANRAQNYAALYAILGELMRGRTSAEWQAAFEKADIPCMRVRELEDLMEDEHLKATGFFTERDHPTEGRIVTAASPFDFSATPVGFRRHAPRLGADGREVLREAGLASEKIEALVAERALILPADEPQDETSSCAASGA